MERYGVDLSKEDYDNIVSMIATNHSCLEMVYKISKRKKVWKVPYEGNTFYCVCKTIKSTGKKVILTFLKKGMVERKLKIQKIQKQVEKEDNSVKQFSKYRKRKEFNNKKERSKYNKKVLFDMVDGDCFDDVA